mgnify:CR=1 FL=1
MESCVNFDLNRGLNYPKKIDVLVLGATPAGLAAAIAYAKLGLSVRVLERHSDLSHLTGSVTINSRSLELLEALGLSEQMIAQGHKIKNLDIRGPNFAKIACLDFSNLNHKFPFLLALSQAELEKIMVEYLKKLGAELEFNAYFIEQDQTGDLIKITVNTPEGEKILESKIVVAADGEFSLVRQKLNIGFGLTEYTHSFSLIDLKTEADYGDATFCVLNNGFLYVQRIKDNLFRLVSNLPNAFSLLPVQIQPEELIWQSEKRVVSHQLRSYQYGRIFFVGSAAHQHIPLDGRDLSMGLEDAVTLAAMTMDQCLELYHDHRYKHNLKLLYHSERLFNLSKPHSNSYIKIRNWMFKKLLNHKKIQARVLSGVSRI